MFLLLEWWIWIALAGTGFVFWAVAYDNAIGAAISIVAAVLLFQFLADIPVWEWLKANPSSVMLGALIYFPIGLGWALLKWYLTLLDAREDLIESKDEFFRLPPRHGIDAKNVTGEELDRLMQVKWKENVEHFKPKARHNKEKIITWISYWPCSMLWSLLDDFIRRTAKAIYNSVSKWFTKMSDRMFQDV